MTISFGSNKLIEAASMSSSFQSEDIPLIHKKGFSMHAIFTGAPVGSFFIAVSIDRTNWIVLDGSSQSVLVAGDIFYNVDESNYLAARLHYAFTSGTGSCDAFFSTKEAV